MPRGVGYGRKTRDYGFLPIVAQFSRFHDRYLNQLQKLSEKTYAFQQQQRGQQLAAEYSDKINNAKDPKELAKISAEAYGQFLQEGVPGGNQVLRLAGAIGSGLKYEQQEELAQNQFDLIMQANRDTDVGGTLLKDYKFEGSAVSKLSSLGALLKQDEREETKAYRKEGREFQERSARISEANLGLSQARLEEQRKGTDQMTFFNDPITGQVTRGIKNKGLLYALDEEGQRGEIITDPSIVSYNTISQQKQLNSSAISKFKGAKTQALLGVTSRYETVTGEDRPLVIGTTFVDEKKMEDILRKKVPEYQEDVKEEIADIMGRTNLTLEEKEKKIEENVGDKLRLIDDWNKYLGHRDFYVGKYDEFTKQYGESPFVSDPYNEEYYLQNRTTISDPNVVNDPAELEGKPDGTYKLNDGSGYIIIKNGVRTFSLGKK